MNVFYRHALFVSAILLCAAAGLRASDESGDNFFKKLVSSGEYSIDETYIGESSVRTGDRVVEDFDEHNFGVRMILTPRVSFGVLRLGVDYELFSFGMPDNVPLPNTLQSAAAVIGLDTRLSDSILIRFEAQPGVYGTNHINGDAFNMPFIIGGTYIYNENIQFIAGISVDIERKYPVIPGAGVRWKVAPKWVVNAVMPKPRIEYEYSKALTFYGGADIKETNFRLPDDFADTHGGKSRLNHAVLTYNEVRAGGGFDWKVTSFLTVTAELGYQPYRSFDYYRTDLRFHEDGSAPYGMLSLHGAF